jgi:pimeloyl-ACP methyl ester carboxylesterase
MRALAPDAAGHVERDGVRVAWEQFGSGSPTILFMPTWSLVHSRCWKAQVPYLARHFRVVTFDPRGNGASDRPSDPAAYAESEFAADALAVMDATDTESAVLVCWSRGAQRTLLLAAEHPERVLGAIFIGPALPLAPVSPERGAYMSRFSERLDTDEGWAKWNAHYWRRDYRGFVEFFVGQIFSEPHSTKQTEDAIGWGLETDPETLAATVLGPYIDSPERAIELCEQVTCPVLVIHGENDLVRPAAVGRAVAEAIGGRYVGLPGSGHAPHARVPVLVNTLIREFVEDPARSPPAESPALAAPVPTGETP